MDQPAPISVRTEHKQLLTVLAGALKSGKRNFHNAYLPVSEGSVAIKLLGTFIYMYFLYVKKRILRPLQRMALNLKSGHP